MTNKRNSVRVAMEAILLLLYAWNSVPIPGTDISRCLVALGREFQIPIDFQPTSTWNSLPLPPWSPPTRATSPLAYLHSGKLLPSLLMNSELIIGNSSTHNNPTLRFTLSATPVLLVARPDLTQGAGRLINLSIPSPVLGSSLPNSTVPPTKSSMCQQSGIFLSCGINRLPTSQRCQ